MHLLFKLSDFYHLIILIVDMRAYDVNCLIELDDICHDFYEDLDCR